MAKAKKKVKKNVSIRRRAPGGRIDHAMEPIVQRAPIRASSYSAGERLMIVELMIFNLVDREIVRSYNDINHLVFAHLEVQKCESLLVIGADKNRQGVQIVRANPTNLWRRLVELKLLKSVNRLSTRRDPDARATITAKGKRHMKKQSKKLQLCAQKLVYTDLLEKLARAV